MCSNKTIALFLFLYRQLPNEQNFGVVLEIVEKTTTTSTQLGHFGLKLMASCTKLRFCLYVPNNTFAIRTWIGLQRGEERKRPVGPTRGAREWERERDARPTSRGAFQMRLEQKQEQCWWWWRQRNYATRCLRLQFAGHQQQQQTLSINKVGWH